MISVIAKQAPSVVEATSKLAGVEAYLHVLLGVAAVSAGVAWVYCLRAWRSYREVQRRTSREPLLLANEVMKNTVLSIKAASTFPQDTP